MMQINSEQDALEAIKTRLEARGCNVVSCREIDEVLQDCIRIKSSGLQLSGLMLVDKSIPKDLLDKPARRALSRYLSHDPAQSIKTLDAIIINYGSEKWAVAWIHARWFEAAEALAKKRGKQQVSESGLERYYPKPIVIEDSSEISAKSPEEWLTALAKRQENIGWTGLSEQRTGDKFGMWAAPLILSPELMDQVNGLGGEVKLHDGAIVDLTFSQDFIIVSVAKKSRPRQRSESKSESEPKKAKELKSVGKRLQWNRKYFGFLIIVTLLTLVASSHFGLGRLLTSEIFRLVRIGAVSTTAQILDIKNHHETAVTYLKSGTSKQVYSGVIVSVSLVDQKQEPISKIFLSGKSVEDAEREFPKNSRQQVFYFSRDRDDSLSLKEDDLYGSRSGAFFMMIMMFIPFWIIYVLPTLAVILTMWLKFKPKP